MALNWRQTRLYTDTCTVYRKTETRAASGKPTGATWAASSTGVSCYLQTGESVKAPVEFVKSEQDNLFTYDILHVEDTVDVRTGDVIKMTAGAQSGNYYEVRGDDKIRSRHANKLSVRCSRLPTPPNGVS